MRFPFLMIFVSCNRDGDIVKVRKIDMAREMEIRREMVIWRYGDMDGDGERGRRR